MAGFPAGVRLELLTDCGAVEVTYRTTVEAHHRAGSSSTFSLWSGDRRVDEVPAVLGRGKARLRCAEGTGDVPTTIYLPEGMKPVVLGVQPVGGTARPAPPGPLWVCYGDSVAEGWVASSAAGSWPATVARRLGLDLVNMGYAGAARGEIASAEHVASLPAALVSIAYGTNCWTRVPFSVGMIREGLNGFHRIVRRSLPTTPIVVVSPILRPNAEREPNALGATLADLRGAMEEVVEGWMAAGDGARFVRGAPLVAERDLPDGVHPNDAGHESMADAIGPVIETAVRNG